MKRGLLFPILQVGCFGLVEAQQIETEILAVSGGALGGDGSMRFVSFGPPDLNNFGESVVRAEVLHEGVKKNALVRLNNGQSQLVELSGDVLSSWREVGAVVFNARAESFGDPVLNDDGRVASLVELEEQGATITSGNHRVIAMTGPGTNDLWILDRDSRKAKVVGEVGESQNVGEAFHLRLGQPYFDEQGGLLYRSVVRASGEPEATYQNNIYRIIEPSDPSAEISLPDFVFKGEAYSLSDSQAGYDLPGPISSQVTIDDKIRTLVQTAEGRRISVSQSGQTFPVLSSGDGLPGAPGFQITNILGYPSNLGQAPPFLVEASNGSQAKEAIVLLSRPIRTLVITGREVKGYGKTGVLTELREPVSTASGAFAFVATSRFADGIQRDAIWRRLAEGVEPRPLAIEGEQVPGARDGVTFRSFGTPFINQSGQVVFAALLNHGFGINSSNDHAFFLGEPNLEVRRIIGEGDDFFFGFLNVLPIAGIALSDLNEAGEFTATLHAEEGKSAVVKFRIPPAEVLHYDEWATDRIPSSGDRNRFDDPDGDGIRNHQEYVYGSDPLDPESMAGPEVRLLNNDGQRILAMEYNRLSGNADINYIVEFSSDLKTWIGPGATEVLGTASGSYPRETVRETQPAPSGRQFVRIRIVEK